MKQIYTGMQRAIQMCDIHNGDKKRICDYIQKKKTVKTGELIEKLDILPKRVWEITNELEKEGIIISR